MAVAPSDVSNWPLTTEQGPRSVYYLPLTISVIDSTAAFSQRVYRMRALHTIEHLRMPEFRFSRCFPPEKIDWDAASRYGSGSKQRFDCQNNTFNETLRFSPNGFPLPHPVIEI